jgi:DNA-binding transcriptional MerR regulator
VAVYSISDLEKLTGIKAHTIRIWEKRYGIVKPRRTPTNIRFYLDEDLKWLFNVALLNRNGFKISRIAKMSHEAVTEQVSRIAEIDIDDQDQIDALTLSLIELDNFKFESILNTNIKQLGLEKTMLEVIYPFLEKLGILWISGSINQVHERYLNYLVKQKIIGEIDKIPPVKGINNRKFLIFLPFSSDQELSLLFLHYLILARTFSVTNLGTHITIEDVIAAAHIIHPDFIIMLNVDPSGSELSQFVKALYKELDSKLIISGNVLNFADSALQSNLIQLEGMDQTLDFLQNLSTDQSSFI